MKSATRAPKRSPLKARPLRLPGQSVERRIDEVFFDEVLYFWLIILFAAALPFWEWIRWFMKTPPLPPWLTSAIALLVMTYAGVRIQRALKKLKALRLGRDGERLVAEALAKVKGIDPSAAVLHDLVAPRGNVDHVVLSRHGIYAIETKTLSKPAGRKAEVYFDGTTLRVDGQPLRKDAIAQATAAARWIEDTLNAMTARTYRVRPVLVFPGWSINSIREHNGARLWVLNPESVPGFVQHEPMSLSDEDLRLAIAALILQNRNTPESS